MAKIDIRISHSVEAANKSQELRFEVFFKEQGIPTELDLDGKDQISYHIIASSPQKTIGVARLTPMDKNESSLSRIAVKKEYRGQGIATELIKHSIAKAECLNFKSINITPHKHLENFYEKFGFKYISDAGFVSGHHLIKMRYIINQNK